MPQYRISDAARADIVDILRLSQTQFGDQARQRYQALILAALQVIAGKNLFMSRAQGVCVVCLAPSE